MSTSRTHSRDVMTLERLQAENAELRRRLAEIEETVRAIQDGTVDALVVGQDSNQHIYTLDGADRPYRLFVEGMQQGAATLYADGTIAYCNQQLANLLRVPQSRAVGQLKTPASRPNDHEEARERHKKERRSTG